jgi:uncharacterized membrane protein
VCAYSVFGKYRAEGYRAAVCSVPAHELTRRNVQIIAAFIYIYIKNYTVTATHFAVSVPLSQGGRNWLYIIFCINVGTWLLTRKYQQ